MPVRILEERHPELVVRHAGDELRAVLEGDSLGFQSRMGGVDVADAKVDAGVPGLHVFALAQHQTQIAEVEEHEGVEAVEQGQAENLAVEGLRAVGVRDRKRNLPYLFND